MIKLSYDYGRFQEEINVTPNYSARTFTIRKYHINYLGKSKFKYRTYRMSKYEFSSALNWTFFDWVNFLRSSNDYYKVD